MSSFADIISKKKKEWQCDSLMDAALRPRGDKISFSSPLMQYCTYGGIPRDRITEFFGENGGGKAQPLYSKILTPTGWINMSDVFVGQEVLDGSGNVCKIDGVYPQGNKPVYEIVFNDNTSIRVADNHLNVVWRRNYKDGSREDFCITTTELINMVQQDRSTNCSNLHVDIPCIDWPTKDVPIDPYLLGALIGSVSLSTHNFLLISAESDIASKIDTILRRDWDCCLVKSTDDPIQFQIQNVAKWYPKSYRFKDHVSRSIPEFVNYLESLGYPKFDYATIKGLANGSARYTLDSYPELAEVSITDNEVSGRRKLLDILDGYGLLCKSVDKHIPSDYLFNDVKVRTALLQGLYDTDGYTSRLNLDHSTNGSGAQYSTPSKQLSSDFAFLVRSLGVRDTIVRTQDKYTVDNEVRICNDSYTHYLATPHGLQFFTSVKHQNRFHERQNPPLRTIVSVNYVGEDVCQCIHVDSDLHTYITDDFVPTHNTTTAVDICKNAMDVFKKEYEDRIQELQSLASSNKAAQAELDELMEMGPKKVLYVDLEHTFDGAWAETLGVDNTEINIMQPPDVVAEDILQTLMDLIATGEIGLAVLDSTPSLVPRAELEKKLGERTVAALAGLLTIFCRKLVPMLTRYHCTFLMINQIRENMDNPYVIKTPGGEAVKFYSSLRIQFKIGSPIDFLGNELPKNTEDPAGYIISARIHKQKSAPNDRKGGSYYLMSKSGIRIDMDYAQLAIKRYGIIKKGGAWFTFTDPYTGEILEENGKLVKLNGIAKVYEYLQTNREYFKKLQTFIMSDIEGKDPDEVLGVSDTESTITASSDIY